jgi:surfeit locus 1 family protein
VIKFHNNHLIYALTWYGLALMVAGGTAYVIRQEMLALRTTRRPSPVPTTVATHRREI